MLTGLREFKRSTRDREPLVRAGALTFVYRHPMSDGNGRIHRFLVNDTRLRDQAIPNGVILPVSASIINTRKFGHGYDRTLDVFSRPFMRRYADLTEHVLFTARVVAHTIRTEMADPDAVRVIRSIKENGWRISGKLSNS
ncbi:MAG: hypothetical protein RLY71_1980 [Pseudomonadota bacterium]|jgi:Fic family protein